MRKNEYEIYNRTALDNTLIYTGVIDMPAGRGHMTLEFSVSAWLVNDWYPTASISDLLVVVMKIHSRYQYQLNVQKPDRVPEMAPFLFVE